MNRSVLALAVVVLGLSGTAQSAEFYKLKLRAKLYYSNLSSRTVRMGSARGSMSGRDDGAFLTFGVDHEEVPATLNGNRAGSLWMGEKGRPDINVTLPYESLRTLMHVTNGALLRSERLERHVDELIDRYINGEMTKADREFAACEETRAACERRTGMGIQAWYVDNSYSSDEDHTEVRLQFHDDASPESLHLVIDFANRVKTL